MKRKTGKKLSMGEKAVLAMREAVAELILEHRKTNTPLVIWKNNKVVKVSPFKMNLP
ncbi:MAG: hypothetical protein PHP45_00880 [Elusimicrobiales bacterium]|nr:hypothetical protein [Elusimicrobiales bacterium]